MDGGAWKAGNDDPATMWTRSVDTLVAPGGSLVGRQKGLPRWRPGIAAVVGSHSHDVPPAFAHETVAECTCFAGGAGGGAFGRWLLTPDEFLGTTGQELSARINGRTVLRHPVLPLVERLWELLAHCSSWTPRNRATYSPC